MFAVLLTIEIVACAAMIGVILLQRSEGGGLGMGSGGGVGGLMSGRGTANALTRTTVVLATIFISTSIGLTLLAKSTRTNSNAIPGATGEPAPLGTLPTLPSSSGTPPAAPSGPSSIPGASESTAPSSPAPADSSSAPAPASSAPASSAPSDAAAPAAPAAPAEPATPPSSGGGN